MTDQVQEPVLDQSIISVPPTPTNEKPEPVKPLVIAPDGSEFIPGPWDAGVAAKKVAWGLGKLGISIKAAPELVPAIDAFIKKVSLITQPYGLTLIIDPILLEKALPFFIFAALAAGLDYTKMKTKVSWL